MANWGYFDYVSCTKYIQGQSVLTTGPGIPRSPSGPLFPGGPWGPTGPVLPTGPSAPASPCQTAPKEHLFSFSMRNSSTENEVLQTQVLLAINTPHAVEEAAVLTVTQLFIIIQKPRGSFRFKATCDRVWSFCKDFLSQHLKWEGCGQNTSKTDQMIPDLICCLRTSRFLCFEVPQMSNYLGTQRTGIKFFWQPISAQSNTFGSNRGLCLVAVKSPLILYFSVNADFACVHVSLPDMEIETPRSSLRCVFSLFINLSGTNIISTPTVAGVARISAKQYNPLVATKHPLLWDFNNSTNLLDLRYISVALGRILELFELPFLCFSNHGRDTRCHGNFCKFHCNVFRQESSTRISETRKTGWKFQATFEQSRESLWSGSACILCRLYLQEWNVLHLRLTLTVCCAVILNNPNDEQVAMFGP